jgi:hypothetical protein
MKQNSESSISCYPIKSVTKFETKTNETDGWSEQTGVEYLIRDACIISLSEPLDPFSCSRDIHRRICSAR